MTHTRTVIWKAALAAFACASLAVSAKTDYRDAAASNALLLFRALYCCCRPDCENDCRN
jgi:hypothetical protein